jgi:hypothetical protein
MKTFACYCGNTLFFRNTACQICSRQVGFLPDQLRLSALDSEGDKFKPVSPGVARGKYKQCRNQIDYNVCNWLIPEHSEDEYCIACSLNRTIPDLTIPLNLEYWSRLEVAKRHTVYSLLSLNLPVISKHKDDARGLVFDFLADKDPDSEFTESLPDQKPVLTGHADGVVTLNIAEADEVARTRIRRHLGEQYRTLLGHFRHEIGHYYWQLLVADSPHLKAFRQLFGDEQADYGEALQHHYNEGPPEGWQENYISFYASAHPWEDWAECWAHYLHMVDTLETAADFGLRIYDRMLRQREAKEKLGIIASPGIDFDTMIEDWLRLSVAINALNRSMGMPDAYPFVVVDPVRAKLRLVHDIVQASRLPSKKSWLLGRKKKG